MADFQDIIQQLLLGQLPGQPQQDPMAQFKTPPFMPQAGPAGGAPSPAPAGPPQFQPPPPQAQPQVPNVGAPPTAGPQQNPQAPITSPTDPRLQQIFGDTQQNPNAAPVPPDQTDDFRKKLDASIKKLMGVQDKLVDQVMRPDNKYEGGTASRIAQSMMDAGVNIGRMTQAQRTIANPNPNPYESIQDYRRGIAQKNLALVQQQLGALTGAKNALAIQDFKNAQLGEKTDYDQGRLDIMQQRADTYAKSSEGKQKIAEFNANLKAATDLASTSLKEAQTKRTLALMQWDELKAKFGNEYLAAASINPSDPQRAIAQIEALKHPLQNAEARMLGGGSFTPGAPNPVADSIATITRKANQASHPNESTSTGYSYKLLKNPMMRESIAAQVMNGTMTVDQAAKSLTPALPRGMMAPLGNAQRQKALEEVNQALLDYVPNATPAQIAGMIQNNKQTSKGLMGAYTNLKKNAVVAETQHEQLTQHLNQAEELYSKVIQDPEAAQQFKDAMRAIQKDPNAAINADTEDKTRWWNSISNKYKLNFKDDSALAELVYHVNAARNEAAKLQTTVSGGGNMGVSDSARHELDQLFNVDMPPNQYLGALRAVRQSGDWAINFKNQMLDKLGAAQAQLSLPPTPPSTGGRNPGGDTSHTGMVKMQAPNGATKEVPASQVEYYKGKGAKVIQ